MGRKCYGIKDNGPQMLKDKGKSHPRHTQGTHQAAVLPTAAGSALPALAGPHRHRTRRLGFFLLSLYIRSAQHRASVRQQGSITGASARRSPLVFCLKCFFDFSVSQLALGVRVRACVCAARMRACDQWPTPMSALPVLRIRSAAGGSLLHRRHRPEASRIQSQRRP